MRTRPDPAARLVRALGVDARRYGLTLACEQAHATPWASATFIGVRIVLRLAIAGGDAAGWLANLPEADLAVPDQLVADCAILRTDDAAVVLEVLLLEA